MGLAKPNDNGLSLHMIQTLPLAYRFSMQLNRYSWAKIPQIPKLDHNGTNHGRIV